jgi:hypothetical protein
MPKPSVGRAVRVVEDVSQRRCRRPLRFLGADVDHGSSKFGVPDARAVGYLRRLLSELEASGASGRVNLRRVLPAVVMIDSGRVYLAERRDQPNLLIAMASADLFTGAEWARALRLPTSPKWRALVGDDDSRLAPVGAFTRRYTEGVLASLVATDVAGLTFDDGVGHPFGPLGSWAVDDLVGPAGSVPSDGRAAGDPAAYDRREFLELLAEVSPLVRPLP